MLLPILSLALTGAAADELGEDFHNAYAGISGTEMLVHVEALSSDAFGGRAPNTQGEDLTVALIRDAFVAAGLAPAFDGSYTQAFDIVERRPNGDARVQITGPDGSVELAPDEYVIYATGPDVSVELEALDIAFAGFGITAPEENREDYRGLSSRHQAAILFHGEPTLDDDSFMGAAPSLHSQTFQRYRNAAEHGIRAVIMIHTEASTGFPWAAVQRFGAMQTFLGDSGVPRPELAIHINAAAGERLLAAIGIDMADALDRAQSPDFEIVLSHLTVSANMGSELTALPTRNVGAYVRGRERPDECLIFTAHWDHLGTRPGEMGEDTVFNGAVDNAMGTAMLLEIAQAFSELDQAPDRSVYFIATGAEERGLLGAQYLAENPPCPLNRIAAVVNMDMHAPFADSFPRHVITGHGTSDAETYLTSAAERAGRSVHPNPIPQNQAFYRSDHAAFVRHGVPGLYSFGVPAVEDFQNDTPLAQRFMTFLQTRYHQVTDEFEPETWQMGSVEEDARIFFETGYRLANASRRPRFLPGTYFRVLQDRLED